MPTYLDKVTQHHIHAHLLGRFFGLMFFGTCGIVLGFAVSIWTVHFFRGIGRLVRGVQAGLSARRFMGAAAPDSQLAAGLVRSRQLRKL